MSVSGPHLASLAVSQQIQGYGMGLGLLQAARPLGRSAARTLMAVVASFPGKYLFRPRWVRR